MENSERQATEVTSARRSSRSSLSLEKLDVWCEKGIFGLVLGILVFTPLALGAVPPAAFVIVQWLTVAILALWVCRFWFNPKHRLLWPPVCWAVVAFMGYAVARYLTADVEYVARQEMIKVLIYGFLFLAILHNLYHLDRIQVVGMVLLGLGTLLAMYGVTQFLTGSDLVYNIARGGYHKRGSGTFINPDHLAGYLEMLLPLALAFTLTGRSGPVRKVLIGYAALAIFAGIFTSISAGGWVSTGLTLVVLFIWLMRMRDYRLQGILLMSAMLVLAVIFILKAELSPNRLDHLSTALQGENVRLKVWKPAIQMWQDHFWFGVGPGHFDSRFREYRTDDNAPQFLQSRPEFVHNDYLNTLVDWGLVGGLLVLGAWALFYWNVFTSWKFVQRAQNDFAAKRSNKASFVMGGSLGLLAILIHSFVDFNTHIPANALLLVALMALVAAHFRYATERYWHTVHTPLRLALTVVLLAAVAYLAPHSWRLTQEAHWLGQAEKSKNQPVKRIEAFEKALAVEAHNYEAAYDLGEACRLQAWETGPNYLEYAHKATNAFARSIAANPYYPFSYLGYGMCLDFLKEHAQAAAFFDKALQLDPNGNYTAAWIGWHYVQLEDWPKSKEWFEKSIHLRWNNKMAAAYLDIVRKRLAELEPK